MEVSSVFELSTLDVILLGVLAVFIFRWWRRRGQQIEPPVVRTLPPLPKQDMTVKELRKYDGIQDERLLLAVNGTIFDVSRGKNFYGPGGPYEKLAGHDATRALGSMDAKEVSDEWDDHEGMPADQVESASEWASSFKFKYPTVGALIKDDKERKDYDGKLSGIDV